MRGGGVGEEGQDGWGVLCMTLGPPDPDVELYWWCRRIGGLWYFMHLWLVLPRPGGKPLEGVLELLIQARVKVLGRPLKYGVGGGWECS